MYVYFARAAFRAKSGKQTVGFVHWKIGRAVNVERRSAALQSVCPIPVEIVGALACESKARAASVESSLKAYFSDSQVTNGWLSLNLWQTKAICTYIREWPNVPPVVSFFNSLPKKIECDAEIIRVQAEFVPHAALHEARLQIKQLRNQAAEAQEKVRISALTYKQAFDSAIEHLTEKYNQAIQSIQLRALH